MKPNKYTSKNALYFVTMTTLIFALVYGIVAEGYQIPETPQISTTGQTGASESVSDPDLSGIPYISPATGGGDDVMMKTTAFSSVECGTTWCRANAGQPSGRKVALNAKYGKAQYIYVPKFDKTYEVIGTTDQHTDLDFWFGADQQSAKDHGVQYLEVNIIR